MSWAARRRILRGVGLLVAATTLVVLGAVTVLRMLGSRELARAAERFEATLGPLDFEAYGPAPVPDDENAALPILEALDRIEAHADLDWRREMAWLLQANRRPAAAWSEEEWRRAGSLLDTGQDILEPLDQAGRRSNASFNLDYASGPLMEIPNLLHALEAGDLLMARARLSWHEDRPDDGAAAVDALATLGRGLEGESPLVFQLVGHGVEARQYRALQDALALRSWGPEDRPTLQRLASTVRERPRSDSLRRALGAEGTFLYSVRPGGEYGRAIAQQRPWPQNVTYWWRGYGTVASGLDYYVRVAEAYPSLTAARLAEDRDDTRPPRNGLNSLMIMNLRFSLRTFEAVESLRRLAQMALDLASEGATRGALPAALPAGAPDDPFLETHALYERASDGSASLTLPGAEEVWERARPGRIRGEDEAPLFTWSLTPPPASS